MTSRNLTLGARDPTKCEQHQVYHWQPGDELSEYINACRCHAPPHEIRIVDRWHEYASSETKQGGSLAVLARGNKEFEICMAGTSEPGGLSRNSCSFRARRVWFMFDDG